MHFYPASALIKPNGKYSSAEASTLKNRYKISLAEGGDSYALTRVDESMADHNSSRSLVSAIIYVQA